MLNGQKNLRSVAEDLISNKQKRTINEFIKNGEGTNIMSRDEDAIRIAAWQKLSGFVRFQHSILAQ